MSWFKKIAFLWSFTSPAVVLASYYLMGGGYWLITGTIYMYVVIPILDQIVGRDGQNIGREDVPILSNEHYFDFLIYFHAFLQVFFVLWGGWVLANASLNVVQSAFLILTIGVYSSGGINIAHELGHKKDKFSQILAQMALMVVTYMHFFIQHNKGHHVHVATPLDPTTSRKGQTLYQFLPQTIFGNLKVAWDIEVQRLKNSNQAVYSIHNAMIWYAILPLAFCIGMTAWLSMPAGHILWIIPFYIVVQSYIAFASLECVNYIEHYGIQRREISPGRYERVNPLHSWNANHLVSNLMLFQLQRHSDHHAYAARPYQVLRHFDESPQLPYGYPVMILMSLVPPLWFKVMDKRLEEWQSNAYNAEHINKVVKLYA